MVVSNTEFSKDIINFSTIIEVDCKNIKNGDIVFWNAIPSELFLTFQTQLLHCLLFGQNLNE